MKHFTVLIFTVASTIGWAQNKTQIEPPAPQPRTNSPSGSQPKAATVLNYEPSEVQKLRLENAQLKLVVIALQIQPLEQKRQEQLAALSQLCEAVVKENHWPDNVKCDPATLKFQVEMESRHEGTSAQSGAPPPQNAQNRRMVGDPGTALRPKPDQQTVPAQPSSSADPKL